MSEWERTHPTDAQLHRDELLREQLEEERQQTSCSKCYQFVSDYPALKPGWGLCLLNTDDCEPYFCEESDTCDKWEPWED